MQMLKSAAFSEICVDFWQHFVKPYLLAFYNTLLIILWCIILKYVMCENGFRLLNKFIWSRIEKFCF